jgi:hypothetical protein
MKRIKKSLVVLLAAGMLFVPAMASATAVFLDYTNFQARLNELTTSAGVANFSAAEISQIQANILTSLQTAYGMFDNVSFSTNAAGTDEEIDFGIVGGGLGLADSIDYRNQTANQLARVFTANFDFIVESGDPRAQQITELSTALAGTGAHELGHNLGLRHYDSYVDPSLTYTGLAGPIATGGVQNTYIMATGSTGLGEAGRETQRDWSQNSSVKLEIANGLTVGGPPAGVIQNEIGDAGNTAATAQALNLVNLAVSEKEAANVLGNLTAGDWDYYSFTASAGDIFTGNVLATGVDTIVDGVDSVLSLFATDGTTLLADDDDIFYSTTQFGAGGFRTLDSLVFNVALPDDGTYFVRVRGFAGGDGNYELLAYLDIPVPEPATLLLLGSGLGLLGLMHRRRRAL